MRLGTSIGLHQVVQLAESGNVVAVICDSHKDLKEAMDVIERRIQGENFLSSYSNLTISVKNKGKIIFVNVTRKQNYLGIEVDFHCSIGGASF